MKNRDSRKSTGWIKYIAVFLIGLVAFLSDGWDVAQNIAHYLGYKIIPEQNVESDFIEIKMCADQGELGSSPFYIDCSEEIGYEDFDSRDREISKRVICYVFPNGKAIDPDSIYVIEKKETDKIESYVHCFLDASYKNDYLERLVVIVSNIEHSDGIGELPEISIVKIADYYPKQDKYKILQIKRNLFSNGLMGTPPYVFTVALSENYVLGYEDYSLHQGEEVKYIGLYELDNYKEILNIERCYHNTGSGLGIPIFTENKIYVVPEIKKNGYYTLFMKRYYDNEFRNNYRLIKYEFSKEEGKYLNVTD